MRDPDDLRLQGVSARDNIWCSDVVSFVSEWRVYVLQDKILHMGHYDGDPQILPDTAVVKRAVDDLAASQERIVAYAIDWGVLSGGGTALIEMNDAFSIGAYGIAADDFTSLLVARWAEMVG